MTRRVTAALLTVQVGFQTCLAAGAPWGRAAYGGRHVGTLPGRYRSISAVAAVGYAAAVVAVGTDRVSEPRRRQVLTAVACFTAVGVLPNAISRSPTERVWAPYCAITAVSAWRARRPGD